MGWAVVAGNGAGSREIAWGWMHRGKSMWGEQGRRAGAGHGGCREVWVSNPRQKKAPLQLPELGKGTKSEPQHSQMCLVAPKYFRGDWPSEALAWPFTGIRTLSWVHKGSGCHHGTQGHGMLCPFPCSAP